MKINLSHLKMYALFCALVLFIFILQSCGKSHIKFVEVQKGSGVSLTDVHAIVAYEVTYNEKSFGTVKFTLSDNSQHEATTLSAEQVAAVVALLNTGTSYHKKRLEFTTTKSLK